MALAESSLQSHRRRRRSPRAGFSAALRSCCCPRQRARPCPSPTAVTVSAASPCWTRNSRTASRALLGKLHVRFIAADIVRMPFNRQVQARMRLDDPGKLGQRNLRIRFQVVLAEVKQHIAHVHHQTAATNRSSASTLFSCCSSCARAGPQWPRGPVPLPLWPPVSQPALPPVSPRASASSACAFFGRRQVRCLALGSPPAACSLGLGLRGCRRLQSFIFSGSRSQLAWRSADSARAASANWSGLPGVRHDFALLCLSTASEFSAI